MENVNLLFPYFRSDTTSDAIRVIEKRFGGSVPENLQPWKDPSNAGTNSVWTLDFLKNLLKINLKASGLQLNVINCSAKTASAQLEKLPAKDASFLYFVPSTKDKTNQALLFIAPKTNDLTPAYLYIRDEKLHPEVLAAAGHLQKHGIDLLVRSVLDVSGVHLTAPEVIPKYSCSFAWYYQF